MDFTQLLFRARIAFGYVMEFIGLRKSRYRTVMGDLAKSNHPLAPAISHAVAHAKQKMPATKVDAESFEDIEMLRKYYLSSDQIIQRQDFGSGHALNIHQEPTQKVTTVSRLCKVAGTPAKQARLLYYLVQELMPKNVLELGTCLGISAAYQLAAMPGEGRFVTIEGDPETAALAQKNLDTIGLVDFEVLSGPFAQVLPGVLESLKQVDYVLIDGHHDGEAMQQYFAMIRPYLSANACVVFDDIDWSGSMQNAWHSLRHQYTFPLALDLGRVGIVIV